MEHAVRRRVYYSYGIAFAVRHINASRIISYRRTETVGTVGGIDVAAICGGVLDAAYWVDAARHGIELRCSAAPGQAAPHAALGCGVHSRSDRLRGRAPQART